MTLPATHAALAQALDDALPQTQCTRCGYPDCRSYAEAMAAGEAAINQCPPGGAEGVARLASITGRPLLPLAPMHGTEGPRHMATIVEEWCIGCTLCIKACPVDCIVGGPKLMHTIIAAQCTGCELCIPACPVDCITLRPETGERTGWQAWSAEQAQQARERYGDRARRIARAGDAATPRRARTPLPATSPSQPSASATEAPASAPARDKRSVIDAALARARATRRD